MPSASSAPPEITPGPSSSAAIGGSDSGSSVYSTVITYTITVYWYTVDFSETDLTSSGTTTTTSVTVTASDSDEASMSFDDMSVTLQRSAWTEHYQSVTPTGAGYYAGSQGSYASPTTSVGIGGGIGIGVGNGNGNGNGCNDLKKRSGGHGGGGDHGGGDHGGGGHHAGGDACVNPGSRMVVNGLVALTVIIPFFLMVAL